MIERLEGRRLNSATALDVDLTSAEPAADAAVTVSADDTAQAKTDTSALKLLSEMLSNLSKTRSEISMTFARNARA